MKLTKSYKIEDYLLLNNSNIILEKSENEIDINEVYTLYNQYNKDYFNNELPNDIKIYYSKLAQHSLGRAKIIFDIEQYSIMIAYSISNNIETLQNVLAHEMIHIWQYYMDIKEGSRKYSSPDFIEYILKSDDKGHNKYFKQWAKDLNSKGFNIVLTIDDFLEIEMDSAMYAIHIVSGIHEAILWNNKPLEVSSILEQFRDRFFEDIDSYEYFETFNENILLCTRLSSGGIRKNAKNIFVSSDFAKMLFDKIGKIYAQEDLTTSSNDSIDKELKHRIEEVLLGFHKHAVKMTYDKDSYSYLAQVMRNVDSKYGGMKSKDIVPAIYENVPKELIDIIYNDWLKVTDKDVIKAKVLDSECSSLFFDGLKKRINDNTINNVAYGISRSGLLDRFNIEDVYQILIKSLGKFIKDFVKKHKVDFGAFTDAIDSSKIDGAEELIAEKILEPYSNDIFSALRKYV